MRATILFVILWSLLLLARGSYLVYSYGQYRLAKGFEATETARPHLNRVEEPEAENITRHKDEAIASTVTATLEIIFLVGLGALFFRERAKVTNATGNIVPGSVARV